MNSYKVWLAYVSYPVTTAVYFERALRRICPTTTIGPVLPPELIEKWQLQNMKLPVTEQDIPTSFEPDMAEILAKVDPARHPDLYLWIESVGGHYPRGLDALRCPRACYLIDSHLNLPLHLEWARCFDYVFIAQREYLDDFRKAGCAVHWLPLACDPEIHAKKTDARLHDIGFVGSIALNPRRARLLEHISKRLDVHVERCFWDDMARVFSQSRIVFNNAVRNDLNMRVFEVMSAGSLLLTDMARNSGQDELFTDGEDYAVYEDETILDTAAFYLDNPALCEQIASRGMKLVHNAHTYVHRVTDMLDVIRGEKATTFSGRQLRERSLAGVPDPWETSRDTTITVHGARRSFVIPVLDYSPASEYNITGLLDDLEGIAGEVIVVFNSLEMAEQLRHHPRINHYAIMKKNVGVARAWNIGLNIAATPTVFIVNSDVHLREEAVDVLEKALHSLDKAACAGPQGSFFDFRYTRDFVYFDKGGFEQPIEVDAVSGFLFAVKLEHFDQKLLKFENEFTPCYFEEWDMGLQIKKAGLKSYVAPTTAYEHHWSGSIRALRTIDFYDRSETAGEILRRNRILFLNKWRSIARRENCSHILESRFREYGKEKSLELIASGNYREAEGLLEALLTGFRDDAEILACKGFTAFQLDKVVDASNCFRKIAALKPEFDVSGFCESLKKQ